MSIDIAEIRKQSDRYTGATGAGQSFLAHQLAAAVPGLLDKVERQRIELRDAGNDLLDVRGILSPNGFPRRVPADVPMVPTVAPAVEWLANEVDRLTELLAFRDREIVGHRREDARLRAEVEKLNAELDERNADDIDRAESKGGGFAAVYCTRCTPPILIGAAEALQHNREMHPTGGPR
jgi:hypothetical protein